MKKLSKLMIVIAAVVAAFGAFALAASATEQKYSDGRPAGE